MKVVKRMSVHKEKWNSSVNLLFTISLNRSEHHTQHHFWCTAADSVGKPSSCLKWDVVTRWNWNQGCRHFLLFCFSFQLSTFEWILMYMLTVRLHVLDRLCFGRSISGIMSSVEWPEIIIDQFGKIYVLSGQTGMETDSSSRYGFVRVQYYHSQTGCSWL